jgi:hypothetical protein
MSGNRLLARALGLPDMASDDELARALNDLRRPTRQPAGSPVVQAPDDPQAEFERLAEQWAKVHNVQLAEGYRAVAKQAPILFERSRRAAYLD